MVKMKKRRKVRFSGERRNTKKPIDPIKKTILIVISIAGLAVLVGAICALFFNPESRTKSKISSLASDYYENYFYDNLLSSSKFQQTKKSEADMEKYRVNGLSPITLSDLFFYGDQKNLEYREQLTKYCDENNTIIKFYMDPPYDRTSYHTEITYACNF